MKRRISSSNYQDSIEIILKAVVTVARNFLRKGGGTKPRCVWKDARCNDTNIDVHRGRSSSGLERVYLVFGRTFCHHLKYYPMLVNLKYVLLLNISRNLRS